MCHNMSVLERRRAWTLLQRFFFGFVPNPSHDWDKSRADLITAVLLCNGVLFISRGSGKPLESFCGLTTKVSNGQNVIISKAVNAHTNIRLCHLIPVILPAVWPGFHCHLSGRRLGSQTPHRTARFPKGSTRSHYSGRRLDRTPPYTRLKGAQWMKVSSCNTNNSFTWGEVMWDLYLPDFSKTSRVH